MDGNGGCDQVCYSDSSGGMCDCYPGYRLDGYTQCIGKFNHILHLQLHGTKPSFQLLWNLRNNAIVVVYWE